MRFPLFIIGNPRSGTTLLRLMLTNHKNIVVPPECGFAVWFYNKYKFTGFSELVVEDFVKDLSTAKKIETWGIDYSKLLNYIFSIRPVSYPDLVATVYEFYGHTLGRTFQRWGDKNNYYLNHIDTIREMFPSVRFIHIIRDGRDVACSYRTLQRRNIVSKYAPNLPYPIRDIALEWFTNVQQIRSSFDKIEWNNVYEIRYEDLVSQPREQLKKLCVFLAEPYDPNMENFYIKNQLEHQEPLDFLQWKEKTVEKPTTSEIGKYQNELTFEEIREFESVSASILKLYNYTI